MSPVLPANAIVFMGRIITPRADDRQAHRRRASQAVTRRPIAFDVPFVGSAHEGSRPWGRTAAPSRPREVAEGDVSWIQNTALRAIPEKARQRSRVLGARLAQRWRALPAPPR